MIITNNIFWDGVLTKLIEALPDKMYHYGLVWNKGKFKVYINGNKLPNKTIRRLFEMDNTTITCFLRHRNGSN